MLENQDQMVEQEEIEGDPEDQETQPQQTQPEQDEFDTKIQNTISKDEARYELMQEEYNSMADKLNDDFERELPNLLSEEEKEMLEVGGDIVAKHKLLRDKFEAYRDERLSMKKSEMDKYAQELDGKKAQMGILGATNRFRKAHPDINMEEFGEFIQEDISPRSKRAMSEEAGEDKYKFLELVYEQFVASKGVSENNEEELPPDLSDINGYAPTGVKGEGAMSNYLRQIGAN